MNETTELSTELAHEQPVTSALSDLRAAAMNVPVEQQIVALEEYRERRASFREWLLQQLIIGLHYGYPPGTEPEYDRDGNLLIWSKGGKKPVAKEQWRKVPSLYQAGADFVCDLMGLRHEFSADREAWAMMGAKEYNFVYRCQLFSKLNSEIVGEGHGAAKAADHQGNVNTAIKMACKRSKVAAVINAYGLSDLFTQDIEDDSKAKPNPAPKANQAAPKAKPRGQRGTPADARKLGILAGAYRRTHQIDNPASEEETHMQREAFMAWARQHTKVDPGADLTQVSAWTMEMIDELHAALQEVRP